MDSTAIDEMYSAAEEYNQSLIDNPSRFYPSLSSHKEYLSLLNLDDAEENSNIMGSIYIPSIKVTLPIYHTTNDEVLSIGVGHMEGSSLPIGGKGTHCILTGHRGLPSARLFTDLDQLGVGDYFEITVLNQTIAYEVESVNIVLPEEMDSLEIDPDKDLCTLVTCTPYGINTHRILVTGHRTEVRTDYEATTDAKQIDTLTVALFCGIPILVIAFIFLMVSSRKKGRDKEFDDEDDDE